MYSEAVGNAVAAGGASAKQRDARGWEGAGAEAASRQTNIWGVRGMRCGCVLGASGDKHDPDRCNGEVFHQRCVPWLIRLL